MIAPETYAPHTAALLGPSRTAGRTVGLSASGKLEKPTQTAEAAHFSRLVAQGTTTEMTGAGACSDTARTAGSMPICDAANTAQQASERQGGFLSFIFGILDVINPLQHIPVISTLYRHLTGDEISPMAQIAGDTLYGGPIGGALSIANVATKEKTGHDIGEHVLAMVTGEKLENKIQPQKSAAPVMVAQNKPASVPLVKNEHVKSEHSMADVLRAAQEEAPAREERKPAPKDQIAAQMMAALDKYNAMNTGGVGVAARSLLTIRANLP